LPFISKLEQKMKIILSRKGFDSSSGGCPNPIMPDNTLLSLPIPDDNSVSELAVRYVDLCYGGFTYLELLHGLKPNKAFDRCHLDPDIREGILAKPVGGWKPAFGQTGSPLGVLRNTLVAEGDLFLFFGIFRKVEYYENSIRFIKKAKPIQMVYGYMQIGSILETQEEIAKYPWHPHAYGNHYNVEKNALYLPSDNLSFCETLPGYGVLSYRADRVLTKIDENPATWKEQSFLMPENILGNRKNSAKGAGLYYAGQWQELVLKSNEDATTWALNMIL
jgi:hypothetical protein